MKKTLFCFRRDLRLEDNTALNAALKSSKHVQAIFIFDENILSNLEKDDPRVQFIYQNLKLMNDMLKNYQSSILILKGKPLEIWHDLIQNYDIEAVYYNRDYEPYARERDEKLSKLLSEQGIPLFTFKDQVIHEAHEVLKNDGMPYTVFTAYKNKWLDCYQAQNIHQEIAFENFNKGILPFPNYEDLDFKESKITVKDFDLSQIDNYDKSRDFPAIDATSYLSPHLRFGTISIRQLVQRLNPDHSVFLSELIWREFFMQILFHFPKVLNHNFRSKYDAIKWRNDPEDFEKWCQGKTGYPMVDAGMRQLNETGYMHNRVRMITAGFLCKHLLIDWTWGERYFASKLLDFELSSNNGNWQWAAGTGCDAAPYFRIFNPIEQQKKFDKEGHYVKRWIPELMTLEYPRPIVDHKFARNRALEVYKAGIIPLN